MAEVVGDWVIRRGAPLHVLAEPAMQLLMWTLLASDVSEDSRDVPAT